MADTPKGPKQDELVAKLVKDAKAPPDILILTGFVGTSSEKGHTRLYFDPQLSDYVEIPNDAILHSQEIPKDQSSLGGTLLWIKKDAVLIHGKVGPNRLKAKFLEGRIQQEFLKGRAAPQQQQGGGSPLTQFGGGCPTLAAGVCTVNGEMCPTTDGACTVVGLNCPTQQVICTSLGPGCQIFTPPPVTLTPPCTAPPQCPAPSHHIGCTIFGACFPTPHCPLQTANCPAQTVNPGICHFTQIAACQIITQHCPALTANCPVQTAAACPPVTLGCPEGGGFGPVQQRAAFAVPAINTIGQVHCVTQLPQCGTTLTFPCPTHIAEVCQHSAAIPCITLNQPACHPSVLTPCVTHNEIACRVSVATPCATLSEPSCRASVFTPCLTLHSPICQPSVLEACVTQLVSCRVTLPAICGVASGAGCPQVSLGCPEGGGPVGGGVQQAAVAGMHFGAAPAFQTLASHQCVPINTVAACFRTALPVECHSTAVCHTVNIHQCVVTQNLCPIPSVVCPSLVCGRGF